MLPGARNIFVSAIPVMVKVSSFGKHFTFVTIFVKNCLTRRLEDKVTVSRESAHTEMRLATTGAREMCSREAL